MLLRPISLSLALLLTTAPVFAQIAPTPPAVTPTTTPRETIEGTLSQERTVIGVPPLATASVQTVAGLRTDSLGARSQTLSPPTSNAAASMNRSAPMASARSPAPRCRRRASPNGKRVMPRMWCTALSMPDRTAA